MLALTNIISKIRNTVRYKLLVLVLFPILLVMPIALVLAIYWGASFSYEQLYIKVNTDLSVSHDVFERIKRDYLNALGKTAESFAFRTQLSLGNTQSIQQQIEALKKENSFSYIHLIDKNGKKINELPLVMPEDMMKHHTSERLHKYQLDLINKGTPQEEIEKHSEDLKSASEESVVRDFKMSLVLEHIAEKERIFVTEDDVNRRISEMAGMYGLDAAGMKKQLEKMNSMSNLRHQLRESKTLNLLMKEANIEEVKEEVKKKTKAKAKQKDK